MFMTIMTISWGCFVWWDGIIMMISHDMWGITMMMQQQRPRVFEQLYRPKYEENVAKFRRNPAKRSWDNFCWQFLLKLETRKTYQLIWFWQETHGVGSTSFCKRKMHQQDATIRWRPGEKKTGDCHKTQCIIIPMFASKHILIILQQIKKPGWKIPQFDEFPSPAKFRQRVRGESSWPSLTSTAIPRNLANGHVRTCQDSPKKMFPSFNANGTSSMVLRDA